MNILILANGFDLVHKLPTTYGDFSRFIEIVKQATNSKIFGHSLDVTDKDRVKTLYLADDN